MAEVETKPHIVQREKQGSWLGDSRVLGTCGLGSALGVAESRRSRRQPPDPDEKPWLMTRSF